MPSESRQTTSVRRLLALLAETAVHAGTGAQLGAVDLPVQRERHTEWPTIYGSGLKGVLRDHAEAKWGEAGAETAALFGPPTEKPGQREADRYAGALAVSDARLLLFPVRTVGHAFAWVTCPLAIARLARDAKEAELSGLPAMTASLDAESALVGPGWNLDGVLLEEFQYAPRKVEAVKAWATWVASHLLPQAQEYAYWRELATVATVVVPDDDFRDFVKHGTEVVTRVKLGEGKTVAKGALWTEENVPADSLMYSLVVAWKPVNGKCADCQSAAAAMEHLGCLLADRPVMQFGGKETTGRGFMAVRLVE